MADTYHFYLAVGPEDGDGSKDRTRQYVDINVALRAFRKAVADGHVYACLELLRDRESAKEAV